MKYIIHITFLLFISSSAIAQNDALENANTLFRSGNYGTAIEFYLDVLSEDRSNREAILDLARSYEYTRDLDKAILWYNEALGHRVSADYLVKLGKLYMRQGNYDEAKRQFITYRQVDNEIGGHYARVCDEVFSKLKYPSLYNVTPLPTNTSFADFAPAFYKDGLVFSSFRNDVLRTDATGGVADFSDWHFLYQSQLNALGAVQAPKFLHPFDFDMDNGSLGPASFSADGKWVAYVKSKYKNGNDLTALERQTDIYLAEIQVDGTWTNETIFPQKGDFTNAFPHLSPDGMTLYYSSNRPGGAGGYDIYMSTRREGEWSKPIGVSNNINSSGDEISPYWDGNELYFSSDYHSGFGGQDIFKAQFKDDDWVLSHLGTEVNTPSHDYGMIFNKKKNTGYFVSDRDGIENIYSISKMADEYNLLVMDASDLTPIAGALVDLSGCGTTSAQTDMEGKLGIKMKPTDCRITVRKEGYKVYVFNSGIINNSGFIEIKLFKESEVYEGAVVDGNTDESIPNVSITVFNQNTGEKQDLQTDRNGKFVLALKPETPYMLKFSKQGYTDVNLKESTGDGTNKNLFGSLLLFPSGGVPEDPVIPSPSVPDVIVPAPSPAIEDTPTPPVIRPEPSVPDTPIVETEPNDDMDLEGFSVQLITLSASNTNMPEGLDELQSLGRIYSKTDVTYKRFRIGIFPDRQTAEEMKILARQKGFEGAYVIKEDGKGEILFMD